MIAAFALVKWSALIGYRALDYWSTPTAYLTTKLLVPLLQVAIFAMLAREYGRDPSYAALGLSVQSLCLSGVFGACRSIGGDRQQGTLSLLLASPASRLLVLASRSIVHVADALVGALVTTTFALVVFGLPVGAQPDPLGAAAALLVTVLSVTAFGLALGSLSLLWREPTLLANAGYWLIFALAGLVAPRDSLPSVLALLGATLPLSFGLSAVRAALAGETLWVAVAVEAAHAIGFFVLAILLYRHTESRIRSHANVIES